MRLSKFQIKVIWLIGLIMLTVISFNLKSELGENLWILMMFLRVLSILSWIIWTVGISEILPEIINLKYKITEGEYNISVKYLTLGFLGIPYWKPIETESHSIEMQNLFGATSVDYYCTDVTYRNENEVMKAIETHKTKFKENRTNWFKKPDPEVKKVRYIK